VLLGAMLAARPLDCAGARGQSGLGSLGLLSEHRCGGPGSAVLLSGPRASAGNGARLRGVTAIAWDGRTSGRRIDDGTRVRRGFGLFEPAVSMKLRTQYRAGPKNPSLWVMSRTGLPGRGHLNGAFEVSELIRQGIDRRVCDGAARRIPDWCVFLLRSKSMSGRICPRCTGITYNFRGCLLSAAFVVSQDVCRRH